MQTRGFGQHDHEACRLAAIQTAEAHCSAEGLQFTPVRRRTLELLLESHAALGAYDLLARLKAEGLAAQPPAAYRALTFLTENGLAHRIERLNAFVACAQPGAAHRPTFLICRACGQVAEAVGLGAGRLAEGAEARGFQIECMVIEAEGLCPACQPEAPC